MGNLNKHKKRVHEGNKPNKCTLCNEKFRKQVDLRKHLIDNHEMQKPYNCGLPFINDFVIGNLKKKQERYEPFQDDRELKWVWDRKGLD